MGRSGQQTYRSHLRTSGAGQTAPSQTVKQSDASSDRLTLAGKYRLRPVKTRAYLLRLGDFDSSLSAHNHTPASRGHKPIYLCHTRPTPCGTGLLAGTSPSGHVEDKSLDKENENENDAEEEEEGEDRQKKTKTF